MQDGLIARAVRQAFGAPEAMTAPVLAKARLCLADAMRCQFETRELPTSRQALAAVEPIAHGVPIAATDLTATPGEAAFAMAVMSAGLLREDMHAASISHHGIIIWPTLLALSQGARVSGERFLTAGVIGYEMGARLGSTLFDAELARLIRPTAFSATAGAALAGAYLLGLDETQAIAAVAIAVDASSGLNQWPHTGADDIFFQAGRAAQNAVTAVRLGRAGAFASPSMLEGAAGLFAAAHRTPPADLGLFAAEPAIMAVYNKPLPICNFAQTAAQAALAISNGPRFSSRAVESLKVSVTAAARAYPGCDYVGTYDRTVQAKMSIRFCVAAALAHGDLKEQRFQVLDDPAVERLAGLCTLEADPALTAAFPALQGARVEATMSNGETLTAFHENVTPATEVQIRHGFLTTVGETLDVARASTLLQLIDRLDSAADADALLSAARLTPPQSAAA